MGCVQSYPVLLRQDGRMSKEAHRWASLVYTAKNNKEDLSQTRKVRTHIWGWPLTSTHSLLDIGACKPIHTCTHHIHTYTHIIQTPKRFKNWARLCDSVTRTVANVMHTLVLFPLSVTSTYYHAKSKLVSWKHMALSVASTIWTIVWRTIFSSPQTTQADRQKNFPGEPHSKHQPRELRLNS